jgi:hypothetical protein
VAWSAVPAPLHHNPGRTLGSGVLPHIDLSRDLSSQTRESELDRSIDFLSLAI